MPDRFVTHALEGGADMAGWAAFDRGELALYTLLDLETAARFQSALVVVKRHNPTVFKPLQQMPTEAYLQDYNRLNGELLELVFTLQSALRSAGHHAVAVHPSETLDPVHRRGLVSHRALAQRAGLGVRGRNNLLVTVPFQSQVRIAAVLTDLRVPHLPEMVVPYPCMECNTCVKACPVGALGENPEDFRLDLCLAYMERIHQEHWPPQVCGVCMAVCPGIQSAKAQPS
ncbi:MAG: epoxyqueuosine reductase [Candidatus Zixiibacteriota bacterium]|nr:MAG: epoxyqueuosine reductase [candidate division Zixibacteria bacterium]